MFKFICRDCKAPSTAKRASRLRCDECCQKHRKRKHNRRVAAYMANRRASDPDFLAADRARVRSLMKALRAGTIIPRRRHRPATKPTEAQPHG